MSILDTPDRSSCSLRRDQSEQAPRCRFQPNSGQILGLAEESALQSADRRHNHF